MTPIENYATEANFLRAIIQGPPGCGKSTLACQFPAAYVIDLDVQLAGPIRFLQKHGLPLPVGYDFLDKDENGKDVPIRERYSRLNKLLLAAQTDERIKTIVFDSATRLVDVFIEEVLRQQNKQKISDFTDPRHFWQFFGYLARTFFDLITRMRRHTVLLAHEKLNKDKAGSIVYPIKVNWPGESGRIIGAYFGEVWRAEVDVNGSGNNAAYSWFIRTTPDARYELKNSLDLPPTFEFKWDVIQQKLDATKTPQNEIKAA